MNSLLFSGCWKQRYDDPFKNSSVWCCCFHPSKPKLAWGLNGGVWSLSGNSHSTSIAQWNRKHIFRSNATTAVTCLDWNVRHLLLTSLICSRTEMYHCRRADANWPQFIGKVRWSSGTKTGPNHLKWKEAPYQYFPSSGTWWKRRATCSSLAAGTRWIILNLIKSSDVPLSIFWEMAKTSDAWRFLLSNDRGPPSGTRTSRLRSKFSIFIRIEFGKWLGSRPMSSPPVLMTKQSKSASWVNQNLWKASIIR